MRLQPFYADWTQAKIAASTTGVTAASVTDVLTPTQYQSSVSGKPYFERVLRVYVLLAGTITNLDLAVSVGLTDANGFTAWTVAQTQEVRALPDASKVVGIFTFDTLNAISIQIALESAITGGGNAKLYYCFQDGDINA